MPVQILSRWGHSSAKEHIMETGPLVFHWSDNRVAVLPGLRLLRDDRVLNAAPLSFREVRLCARPPWAFASASWSSALSTSISSSPWSLLPLLATSSLMVTAGWGDASGNMTVANDQSIMHANILWHIFSAWRPCDGRLKYGRVFEPDLISCLTLPDFSRSSLYSRFSCLTIFLL